MKKKIINLIIFCSLIFQVSLAETTEQVAILINDENSAPQIELVRNYDYDKYDGLKIEYEKDIEESKDTVYNKLKVLAYLNERTNRQKDIGKILNIIKVNSVDIVPETWSTGEYIVINTDKLILTYYKDGKVEGKYPIAAGFLGKGKKTVTPNMTKKIINKAINPYWNGMNRKYKPVKGGSPNNPLGKRWMGLDYEYGIHGTNKEDSIGKYISHGCMRMYNSDVESLFPNIKIGTTVIVGDEEYLKKNGIIQFEGSLLKF